MKFNVLKSIDLYAEFKKYLQLLYKNEVPYTEDLLTEMTSENNSQLVEIYREPFFYHEIIQRFKINKDNEFELFFQPFSFNQNVCLATLLGHTLEITDEEKVLTLNDLLNQHYSELPQILNHIVLDDEISTESKYRLFLYIHNFETSDIRFSNYMNQYTKTIQALEKEVIPFLDSFMAAYDESELQKSIELNYPELMKYDAFTIRPVMLFENQFTVSLKNFDPSMIFIDLSKGYLAIQALQQSTEQLEQNFTASAKILADKIKFDILKACLSEEKFGAQLAKELAISTALVSYHLQPLVSHRYVISNVKNKRIYYRTNKEQIQKDLNLFDIVLKSD